MRRAVASSLGRRSELSHIAQADKEMQIVKHDRRVRRMTSRPLSILVPDEDLLDATATVELCS